MKTCRNHPALVARCLALLVVPGLLGQAPGMRPQGAEQKAEAPMRYSLVAFDSESRRDPFLNPLLIARKNDELNEEEPQGQPPPGIAGMFISQVRLVGTSARDDGSTAVFKGTDNRAYFLQEGDRLFDGYLKQVGTDLVLLVRETRLKSGKVLTEEVAKRLRTP